jgi:hypothetical protein
LAPNCKQFLSYKDSEGCTNDPAYNPHSAAAQVERVEFSVIAGPTSERLGLPGLPQLAHQVAVRVQTGGTATVSSPFCRRASRSRAPGTKTDGMVVCLLSSMGGMTMY